jgi:hypothetical protein
MNTSKSNTPDTRSIVIIVAMICATVLLIVVVLPTLQQSSIQNYGFVYLAAFILIAYNLLAQD